MSVERNKAVVRSHFEEIWEKGNLDFVDENLTPDFVNHDPRGPEAPGVEGLKQYVTMVRNAFPDISVTVEDVITEGDKVAARAAFRAIHQGEYQGIPPTGKEMTVELIGIFRVAEGKIAEAWILRDDLSMMQQLGVVPPPGQGE